MKITRLVVESNKNVLLDRLVKSFLGVFDFLSMVENCSYSKMELEERNKYMIAREKEESETRRLNRKKIKKLQICQKAIYVICLFTLVGLCLLQVSIIPILQRVPRSL